MQLVGSTATPSAPHTSDQRWDTLKQQLGGSPSPDSAMQVDGANDDADEALSSVQLADAQLENVAKCGDCGKPVLQSAMEEHAVTCAAIREGRLPEPGSGPLKRRLSEASNGSSQPQKKSKLVLHLGGAAAPKAPGSASSTPAPPEKKNRRVVDVDRQCGVINEKGYPCPRSLTCKTHNMSAKRAVPGRSQPFDMLLFEWQKANKAKEKPPTVPADGSSKSGTASRPAAGGVAALGSASTAHSSAYDLTLAAAGGGAGATGGEAAPPSKPKKRKTATGDPALYKLPGEGGSKKAKKGVVYVGEWEESDDDAGVDELVDSEEEVEAVLRGIGRVERGRPLFIARGGGAGFSAASLFNGRNQKLARLHDVLADVFRPPA
ncbi:hypothetical protein JCM8097_004854 [Rhodosporidiobolus ruineniae]